MLRLPGISQINYDGEHDSCCRGRSSPYVTPNNFDCSPHHGAGPGPPHTFFEFVHLLFPLLSPPLLFRLTLFRVSSRLSRSPEFLTWIGLPDFLFLVS